MTDARLLQWFEHWVTSGSLVDTIIAITVVEVLALWTYHRVTKSGLALRDYFLNVVSGLCLMFALRCSLGEGNWHVIALFLSGAGVANVADIALRLRSSRPGR